MGCGASRGAAYAVAAPQPPSEALYDAPIALAAAPAGSPASPAPASQQSSSPPEEGNDWQSPEPQPQPEAQPSEPERGPRVDPGSIMALPEGSSLGRLLSPPNANVLERRAALGSLFAAELPEPDPEPEQPPAPPPAPDDAEYSEYSFDRSIECGGGAEPEPPQPEDPPPAQPGPDAVITLLRAQRQQAVGLPSSAPFDAFLRRPRLCRTTATVAPSPEAFGVSGTTSPLLGRLPPELLLEVLCRVETGRSLCRAAVSCRRLHHAIFLAENDRAIWRPMSMSMAADGISPRRNSGCCWRELYVRLISIDAVSLRCRLLEANASSMLEAVLPKVQSAQLSLLETLIQPHLDSFREIEEPPREVLFACDAMVLLCGADLERAGANVHEWGGCRPSEYQPASPDGSSDGSTPAAASGGMTKEGWLQFRNWFFAEEPCSFLGLRLWELDKNSLSAEAVSRIPRPRLSGWFLWLTPFRVCGCCRWHLWRRRLRRSRSR